MTDVQKNSILEMRRKDTGITQIANDLGLSVNTVKAFLRRNKANSGGKEKPSHCKQCGEPLNQQDGGRVKEFCGDRCRFAWWNKHRLDTARGKISAVTCRHCGKTFNAYEKTRQRYCGQACYFEARFGKREENDG